VAQGEKICIVTIEAVKGLKNPGFLGAGVLKFVWFPRLAKDLQPGHAGGIIGVDLQRVEPIGKVELLLRSALNVGPGRHLLAGQIKDLHIGGDVCSRPRQGQGVLGGIGVSVNNECGQNALFDSIDVAQICSKAKCTGSLPLVSLILPMVTVKPEVIGLSFFAVKTDLAPVPPFIEVDVFMASNWDQFSAIAFVQSHLAIPSEIVDKGLIAFLAL